MFIDCIFAIFATSAVALFVGNSKKTRSVGLREVADLLLSNTGAFCNVLPCPLRPASRHPGPRQVCRHALERRAGRQRPLRHAHAAGVEELASGSTGSRCTRTSGGRARAPQAEDLTQEFFTRLLEKKQLAIADQSKGRFRNFLLTAVKRFLVNEWDKSQALKRGGGRTVISMDSLEAETRYSIEPVDDMTPSASSRGDGAGGAGPGAFAPAAGTRAGR